MRRFILSSLLMLFTASVFGHAGEVHSYMGTIRTLDHDGSFLLDKTDGTSMKVQVSKTTVYLHADGTPAKRAVLTAGKRAVVTIAKDGKTATTIRIAARKR
jgi:ferric-dicitrate binding protein FerR (iron transport regulator)